MQLGKALRDNRKVKSLEEGINVYTADYFELTYEKFGENLILVFMAPDEKKASIKAKSILHTYNGDKIIDIRKLDSKRLGPSLSWQKDGTKYGRFQTRVHKLQVRLKS